QLAYWHTLLRSLGTEEQARALDAPLGGVVDGLDVPRLLLDPRSTVDQVVRQEPRLAPLTSMPQPGTTEDADPALTRALLVLKAIGDVFSAGQGDQVTAEELTAWQQSVRSLEATCGLAPGRLTGQGRGTGTGGGPAATQGDLEGALAEIERGRGLMSIPDLQASVAGREKKLIDKMALHELLKDPKLADRLAPSMALTEQLLRSKHLLEGPALAQAKKLIRRFVDELADALAREVASATKGPIDRSTPPKRTFRNLDLKRTLWANLTNWDPAGQRLMVDRLFYKQRARKIDTTRLIVVVDQSGSMVPALVNCTILASIFAGLPKVQASLIAYDTTALDLTPWVHDPFEVLLRTQLGGGTDGTCALPYVTAHLGDPRRTVIAWISDFYDNRALMPVFTSFVRSGIKFLPVGSVSSSGYFSVDAWFRQELKALGTPVLSGSLRTLVRGLKAALA
ncbi:MAG TPA: VWA domain-containing protein, partial [Myxococcota bacterium]|nr:VWA domain-containing protein [Myxococcota bacterium]